MEAAIQGSQSGPVLSLFDLLYQNGSRTYRGPCASADRVNVWSLWYIL